jgi:hypothetical protein
METISVNNIQLQTFLRQVNVKSTLIFGVLNKLISYTVVFLMLFLAILAIFGIVSTTQKLESDVGLRHKNVSVKEVSFFNKIKSALMEPTKVKAFSLNPLDGLGEILGGAIKAVTEPVFQIISNLLKGVVLPLIDSIIKPILTILNGILDLIGGLLNVVESLAANLSGTRVGIGFVIYRDIEGAGQGSSNFESAKTFTKRLMNIAAKGDTLGVIETSFPKKDEIANLIADAVAWSDFMNVQKALQSNVVKDYIAAALEVTNGVDLDKINSDMTNIVVGHKCENANAIFSAPVFRSFGVPGTTCDIEIRGEITQKIRSRQSQVFGATLEKSKQMESSLPANCKGGQYFDIAEGPGIDYDESKPGDLGIKISTFAKTIQMKSITGEECQNLTTGKQEQIKSITEIFSAANITAAFGAGSAISTAIGTLSTQLGKTLFKTLTDKFNKAMDIIKGIGNQIKSGFGIYGAFNLILGIKAKLTERITILNKEFDEFKAGTIQSLNLDTINNETITA